jgi:phosphoribosylformimino-5-aminoimidazole carboxamide ribotide isomerase
VIPVIDLKSGQAVHAVAGDRDHYRPLRTRLHPGSDPLGLALAYRDVLCLRELYLADLDAIAGAPLAEGLYRAIQELGLSLWVDAGVRDRSSLPPLRDAGVETMVLGLETLRGPEALVEILDEIGPARAMFSLDLRSGVPVTAVGADWGTNDPRALAETAVTLGVQRLLLLDLARVGTGHGTGTDRLLSELASSHPDLELCVGGGISALEDLHRLACAGAAAVLVGSALHDGRIGAEELRAYR